MKRRRLIPWLVFVLSTTATAVPPQREASVVAVLPSRTAPVTARLQPNRARTPAVGIVEEGPGSAEQWLPTLWQAFFVATRATDTSVLDFEVSLRVGGPVDGPSAGLLTATTLAALITGKKVLPATTMSGVINPDGSVGPVGSVVARLRTAAESGVKRFGFPVGARQQPDASGTVIDLVVEAKKLGVEVKELNSIDEAFTFLTGQTLPRAAAATEAEMELWPAELVALSNTMAEVRKAYEAERPRLTGALQGVDPKIAATQTEPVERLAASADELAKNGDPVRALAVWSLALSNLRITAQDLLMVRALDEKNLKVVFAVISEHEQAIPRERDELRAKIDRRFPNDARANDVYAMDILESVVTLGDALRAGAAAKELEELAASGAVPEEHVARFRRVARQYAEELLRVREELRNGDRFVSLYASLPAHKKSRAPLDAAALSRGYLAAGAASVTALKTLPTFSAFAQDRVWLDVVGYTDLLATETNPRARLVVAARQTLSAASLGNVYEALGGQLDAKGALSIRNTRALAAQLEQARLRVFQACGRAKQELGFIPFPARIRFLNARAEREGNDRQKADALSDLWVADWWCGLGLRDKR